MNQKSFLIIIILISVFFIVSIVTDEEYIVDHALQQIYEASLLAVLLGLVGVMASKYYGDVTANDTIRELTKVLSELEQKIQNLESKFDKLQDSIKNT